MIAFEKALIKQTLFFREKREDCAESGRRRVSFVSWRRCRRGPPEKAVY